VPAGPIAAANRTILFNSLAVMLVIVVPTLVAILAFAWWFRASNPRARRHPHFTYSGRIELIVWSIPTLTILFLGGLIWYGSHQLDPRRPIDAGRAALEIQAVSLDWKWLFIYPGQQVASINELVVPAGVPLRFRLTSASVMNTFFIPQLGSMIYTMNGMETELNLMADREGIFFGQSAHYSGDGFSDMNFKVRAVPEDAFEAWASGLRGKGGALDAKAYAALAQQSRDVPPMAFGEVQPDLFDAVVRQALPPGPGPATGRGGDRDVHPESADAPAGATLPSHAPHGND
jgi:cytochrome o ubiquinol oxidase subunit 2